MDKKYDFRKTEREMQALWEKEGIYRYRNGREKKVFSIDTPPPTVSGSLHIGHVFSYTQAEMIARFKRMQGYDVFYPFGFDDNGLPTERLVERDGGFHAADMPRSQFREKCMETIESYEADFRKMWQSLGFSVDWSLQYRTVSGLTAKISQRAFLDLVRQKKAYMKESPVLWWTQCRTSCLLYTSQEFAGNQAFTLYRVILEGCQYDCGSAKLVPAFPAYDSLIFHKCI